VTALFMREARWEVFGDNSPGHVVDVARESLGDSCRPNDQRVDRMLDPGRIEQECDKRRPTLLVTCRSF